MDRADGFYPSHSGSSPEWASNFRVARISENAWRYERQERGSTPRWPSKFSSVLRNKKVHGFVHDTSRGQHSPKSAAGGMADTRDSKPRAEKRPGSSPGWPTKFDAASKDAT